MANLAPLIIKQIEGQNALHHKESAHVIAFDDNFLPQMRISENWSTCGTAQWSNEELAFLQSTPAIELGKILAEQSDSWVQMAAIAEFAMHGEDAKARELTQTILQITPTVEEPLTQLFGNEVMTFLKQSTLK